MGIYESTEGNMIIIKVEIWPFGDESAAREIARGKIINDGTGNKELGNYNAEFYEWPWQGPVLGDRVEGHYRKSSVWLLIKKALKEII